jgi:hypothetical protein
MNTFLHATQSFLTSREFAINFFANLAGAMVGVLLAFWVERFRTRRDARMLYGRILRTSRSELSYLRPICEHGRDRLRDGERAGSNEFFDVPATKALLINPLVHDQAPYSLIMTVTTLCSYLSATQNVFHDSRWFKPQGVAEPEVLKILGDQLERASNLISITLEQIDSQLKLLGLKKTPDSGTQEVSRRLREILQSSQSSMRERNLQPHRNEPPSQ